jgi:hypothetical protein
MSLDRQSTHRDSGNELRLPSSPPTTRYDSSRTDPTGIDGRPPATTPGEAAVLRAAQRVMTQNTTAETDNRLSRSDAKHEAAKRKEKVLQSGLRMHPNLIKADEYKATHSRHPNVDSSTEQGPHSTVVETPVQHATGPSVEALKKDFSEYPRTRNLERKRIPFSQRESPEKNKKRFIKRNIKKIDKLEEQITTMNDNLGEHCTLSWMDNNYDNIAENLNKILQSCYNHGPYFNDPEADFTSRNNAFQTETDTCIENLRKFINHEINKDTLITSIRKSISEASNFLKTLRSRLESLQTGP